MQNQTHCLEAGLKDPSSFSSQEANLCKLSPIMISNITTNNDDYIGNESSNDLQNENEIVDQYETPKTIYDNKAKRSSIKKEKRVFPPLIPLLARTENLACHMPWVLKRYYTSEGGLILKEEKVRYHEYFQAHRENGRLTLQLVPLDDHDEDEDEDEAEFFGTSDVEAAHTSSTSHEENRDQSQITNDSFEDEEDKSSNIVEADEFFEAASTSPHETHDQRIVTNDRFADEEDKNNIGIPVESDNVVGGGANGGLNCLNCSNIFRVPVHPIRTVHG